MPDVAAFRIFANYMKSNVSSQRSTWSPLQTLWLAPITLSLNVVWEIAQLHAYEPSDLGMWQHAIRCAIASLGDMMMTYGILFIACVALKIAPKGVNFDVASIIVAAPIAGVVEAIALRKRFWAYSPVMPTLLGIGMFPLLQLSVLNARNVSDRHAPVSAQPSIRNHDRAPGTHRKAR